MSALSDLKATVNKIVADIAAHKAADSGKDAQIADLTAKLDAATKDAASTDTAITDANTMLLDADTKLLA